MQVDIDSETEWIENPEILDAFPTAVVICDQQGVICQANSELFELFGYTQQQLLGNSINLLLPEGLREKHQHYIDNFMDNPIKRKMGMEKELKGRMSDGRTFPLEVGLNPIKTADGWRVIGTIVDISQRHQLERNFRSIIDSAPVAMLTVDHQGHIQHCNQLLLTTFGYQAEELLGQPIEILLPERYRSAHPEQRLMFHDHPSQRAMGSGRDLTGLHKNGSEIPLEIGLNPIENAQGRLVVATIIDITERTKSELNLKQANADMDEFTYVASHDLKSPLRGINSLIEWITEDLGDNIPTEVKNNLERMQVRTSRMEKLIEDLLAYARSGRRQGDARTFRIDKLVSGVLLMIDHDEAFQINLTGYQGEIQASQVPLETVLRNLVSNAIKHHDKAEGIVNIAVSTEGSFCIFDITDDGPGIPPSAKERVFKLFQTLSNEDGTRSGVGLAVCKRLIEAHGGSIELHTEEGERGCHFRFYWPRFARRDIND